MAPLARALLACLVASAVAHAGGEFESEEQWAEARQRAAAWRRLGKAGLPKALAMLCSEDWVEAEAARAELVKWGSATVPALLSAEARDEDDTCAGRPRDALVELICNGSAEAARGALRRVLEAAGKGRLDPRSGAALAVLAGVGALPAVECPRRGAAVAAAVQPMLARLGGADDEAVLWTLRSFGAAAAVAVPRLVPLLERAEVQAAAAEALGGIGPQSAEAVPALERMLDGPNAISAAHALQGIGAPAAPALPHLAERLAAARCEPASLEAFSRAVAHLGATSDAAAAPAVAALTEGLRACPARRAALLEAVGLLQGRGRGAAPAVKEVLRDDALSVFQRREALVALLRIGAQLDGADTAIAQALEARLRPPSFPTPQLELEVTPDQRRLQPEAQALWSLNVCRGEAGRPPLSSADLSSLSPSALEGFAGCLAQRLCLAGLVGPKESIGPLTSCCAAAFGAAPPSWCADP